MGVSEMTDRSKWRVMITGGSGFIGTVAIDYYRRMGASICNLDIAAPKKAEHAEHWCNQDILDREGVSRQFQKFKPTHLIHLAARADLDESIPVQDFVENIDGVESVMEAAKNAPGLERVLVASTMYVCRPGYSPTNDEDYCPHTIYGESKVLTEKITRAADLKSVWCIVRPAVIWGPYHERLANEFFRIVRKGLYFHPGRTNAMKSYGYVENTVYQMDGLLAAQPDDVSGRVFYLADPPIGVFDWADEFSRQLINKPIRRAPLWFFQGLALIGDLLGKIGYDRFPMTSFRLRNMTHDGCVDIASTEAVTGSVPVSLEEGVGRTVAWIRAREHAKGE